MLIEEFLEIKQKFLEKNFKKMNNMQKKAIFSVNGPVLVLAGAGSGKTTIIVNRILYLLEYGDCYYSENGFEKFKNISKKDFKISKEKITVNPPKAEEILAITFTNKAAKELKQRLEKSLKEKAKKLNTGTFHSQCIKILVKYITLLGYKNNFVIYDITDSKNILKGIISNLNLNNKIYQPKNVLYEISRAKNNFLTAEEFEKENELNFSKKEIAKIYKEYQKSLKNANALDFDDILLLTVKLLKENEKILEKYQKKFKYIMVDEYQDTNRVQYELVKLLSGYYNNLCVVGDDDQSIYKFRGAAIENILNFEKQLKNVKTIKLEQNYRSTKNILNASNHLIANNKFRKNKTIWTNKEEGEKIKQICVCVENEEAEYVCKKINENVKNNMNYKDHVVLYRLNAQSANIEKFLIRNSIPYQIIGSTKFYDRKEIKDFMSYLAVLDNSFDNLRLIRIINEPKRGIGTGTVSKLQKLSKSLNISIYQIIEHCENYEILSGKLTQLKDFFKLIEDLKKAIKNKSLGEIFEIVIEKTKYLEYLKEEKEEFRIENLKELKTNMLQFELENENASLKEFLFEISLYTDLNDFNQSNDKITLMTLHAAKGLEFPIVFIIGMEEGIFPGNSAFENLEELEEERRLFYVGMTRAKKELFLICSAQRMIFGSTKYAKPSRFLKEIPDKFKEIDDKINKKIPISDYEAQKITKIAINDFKKIHPTKPLKIDFKQNEFVLHSVFGKGMVISITPLGDDHLVEIEFEKKGRKKVMANYAKLKKV